MTILGTKGLLMGLADQPLGFQKYSIVASAY